jgi:superfamily II DNA/RNA helicase
MSVHFIDIIFLAVAGYNIIVCTPGRLLQQLDESYHFRCDNLKMLVFDECDRLLDMGFQVHFVFCMILLRMTARSVK